MTTPSADALLDELNGKPPAAGADAMPPMIDEAPEAAPDRDRQLTVGPKPALSPAKRADAQHSTAAGGAGYRVKLVGEYLAHSVDGKGKVKKPYTVEVNVAKLDGCLSIINNKLIKPALSQKYPDFVAVRTCSIEEQSPLSPSTPKSRNLAYMNREELEEYVRSSEPPIPIDLATFSDVIQLREAVIDYVQTPKGFEEREKHRQEQRTGDVEIAKLNPGLNVGK